tara:strand:- start:2 stop:265 length:264 start_codon:yes stop_codon:yes gene_type:complete
MKVFALHCHECNTVIYSRARHDYHHCLCNNIAIDGGFDYVKFSWTKPNTFTEIPQFDIGDVSKETLYDDWNKQIDNYGIVTNAKLEI